VIENLLFAITDGVVAFRAEVYHDESMMAMAARDDFDPFLAEAQAARMVANGVWIDVWMRTCVRWCVVCGAWMGQSIYFPSAVCGEDCKIILTENNLAYFDEVMAEEERFAHSPDEIYSDLYKDTEPF
jgi:hypothetical protein